MSEIIERCTRVFAEVMQVDPALINDETDPETLPEWDSLSHVQLILLLEKEFAVTIPPDEGIGYESFKMVCDAMATKVDG